jgi:hypothetical protein
MRRAEERMRGGGVEEKRRRGEEERRRGRWERRTGEQETAPYRPT